MPSAYHESKRVPFSGSAHHKLSEVDKEAKLAVCSVCGPTKVVIKNGGATCWTRAKEWKRRYTAKVWDERRGAKKVWKLENALPSGNDYRRFAKPFCEKCGFLSFHPIQIDVHHKDGNRSNNHVSNLQSLCALCHRLEHLPEDEKMKIQPKEQPSIEALKSQIKVLLDDNERLQKELDKWKPKPKSDFRPLSEYDQE